MPLDGPAWQVVREEVDKVLLDLVGARRVGDAWDQDRRKQSGGIINVEVGACCRYPVEAVVGEPRVCDRGGKQIGGEEKERDQCRV